jgi:hypothetical protein
MTAVTLRRAHPGDCAELKRLAALDSRELPPGPFVVAEVDGSLVAATPLEFPAEPVSDPFRHTAALVELLELRARQLATA